MKNFISGKIYLNLEIIQKIQSFLMRLIKKVIGKMKDEFGGVTIIEFVGLKPKIFKDVLFNKKIIRHKMRRIQSKKHRLGTYKIDKISLSCFDNKRYVLDDGIHTLSYFHKNSLKSCNN